ncbi:hypothetical protein jhhlp_000299 [Lomentospora prolificans]|uniref:Probable aspartic-type endopeptidase OPSB n=1 Tax=Lomentospora prolificans TaxID=41688 RepID=A0A2N3NKM6_9PEZI|nr:hypothetical protein jhhlp_000299 [Lomentospora prolificans]
MKLSLLAASLLGRNLGSENPAGTKLGRDVLSADKLSSTPKARDVPLHVVRLDMWRNDQDPIESHSRRKRQVVETAVDNMLTLYFVNATVGTPPQEVRLHVDTGSSDMWVNTPSSDYCSAARRPCANAGTYDPAHSGTHTLVDNSFNISYVDGSGASGDFVTDVLTIGDASVEDLQFGVGLNTTSPRGILGIGYTSNEANVLRDGVKPYENLPIKLVSQGLIQSAAFSMFLDDFDSRTGTVLFGGIDRGHFTGDLITVPIQQENGQYRRLLVTLDKIGFDDATISENMALAVLLDSGSSITYLPDNVAQAIFKKADATYMEEQGLAFVPCSNRQTAHDITFSFDDPLSIVVPYSELVLNIATNSGKRPIFGNGEDACLFGIAPAGSGSNVLGDTFMRSAYVVFDLENNEISMAQAATSEVQSDVAEIAAGSDPVPGATRVAKPVAATQGLTNTGQEVPEDGNEEEGVAIGLGGRSPAAVLMAAVVAVAATVVLC